MNVEHCSFRAVRPARATTVIIFFFCAFAFAACSPGRAFSEPRWSFEADAAIPGFLERGAFAEVEYGYTDVVPPHTLPRRYKTAQTGEGYAWELQGTELSLWQLAPVPQSARYLLKWNFLYEGAVVEGRGRTGFIFGNPASANLMSVELTASGSLRVMMWGRQGFDRLGRVIFSQKAAESAASVKIEASYDIRARAMTCRVNGGEEIVVDFRRYIPSAPITIRGVGFFSAVPEAMRRTGAFDRQRSPEYDIDLSSQWARTLHRRLAVDAE